jgi:hypothetical protein
MPQADSARRSRMRKAQASEESTIRDAAVCQAFRFEAEDSVGTGVVVCRIGSMGFLEIPPRKILLDEAVQHDEKVPAPHLLDLEL